MKVPLGKLNSERMVPLDEETVAVIDRIVAHRSPGRAVPHPRTSKPTDFLLTQHGRRVSIYNLRQVLTRVTQNAGLPHTTPHQLRHTYATALEVRGIASDASSDVTRDCLSISERRFGSFLAAYSVGATRP